MIITEEEIVTARKLDRKFPDKGNVTIFTSDEAFKLVELRLKLRILDFANHLIDNPGEAFTLGVTGNPNVGKTTLAWSIYKTLENFGLLSWYCDLDLHSPAGPSMAGEIAWVDKPKFRRIHDHGRVAWESIETLKQLKPGIVVADFPGRPGNPYQIERGNAIDLGLILYKTERDRLQWGRIFGKVQKPYLALRTSLDDEDYQKSNTMYDLRRDSHENELGVMVTTTKILEKFAQVREIPLLNVDVLGCAREAGLFEMLDSLYAPAG